MIYSSVCEDSLICEHTLAAIYSFKVDVSYLVNQLFIPERSLSRQFNADDIFVSFYTFDGKGKLLLTIMNSLTQEESRFIIICLTVLFLLVLPRIILSRSQRRR